jgi:hypothetical protein
MMDVVVVLCVCFLTALSDEQEQATSNEQRARENAQNLLNSHSRRRATPEFYWADVFFRQNQLVKQL